MTENMVTLNPWVNHNFPYINGHLEGIPNFQTNPFETLQARLQARTESPNRLGPG